MRCLPSKQTPHAGLYKSSVSRKKWDPKHFSLTSAECLVWNKIKHTVAQKYLSHCCQISYDYIIPFNRYSIFTICCQRFQVPTWPAHWAWRTSPIFKTRHNDSHGRAMRENTVIRYVVYSIGVALVAAVINQLVAVDARWMCMVIVCCRSLSLKQLLLYKH